MTTRVLLDDKDAGTAAKSTLRETYHFMGKLMFEHAGKLEWVRDEMADREAAHALGPTRPKPVATSPAPPPVPNGHHPEDEGDLPKFATKPPHQSPESLIDQLARGLDRGARMLLFAAIPAALAMRHLLGA